MSTDQPEDVSWPFSIRNLSVLAYAQGFTLWHYKAGPVPMRRVGATGFMDPAANMVRSGDLVMASGVTGGAIFLAQVHAGTVVLSPITGDVS